MKRTVFVFLVVICATAFAQAQSPVRRVIEANTKQFIEAFNKGDAVAVANMYVMNARLLPPNSEMVEGRANIQKFWQGASGAGMKLTALDIVDLEVHGNTAIEVGRYTATMPGAGGTTTTDSGKYVVVWKREGRAWKLAIDVFNTNLPATP
jgi:uncharacterized protein (TIGR02246 family)